MKRNFIKRNFNNIGIQHRNNTFSYSLPFRQISSNLVRAMYRLASTKVSDQFVHLISVTPIRT